MSVFSTLSRNQKESIGLLQVGTFLEYFDLMLYVHMAVLLNELFFPKTDPHTAALLTSFAFCSTFVMRPFGALIFGWLGDNVGRKSTIIITTIMMSISCISIAILPTYAQIGISAAWIMLICRMTQGMASMGEIMGALIYVTESIPRPASYHAVSCIVVASSVGSMVATGIASLVTSNHMDWRVVFWIGAGIALIGAVARSRLRETPDFLELKRKKMQEIVAELNREEDGERSKIARQKRIPTWKEPLSKKTLMAYFFINCGWPFYFFLAFIYFNPILKDKFGYTPEAIISHNFLLSIVMVLTHSFWAYLSSYIHPLKLLKFNWIFAVCIMFLLPFIIPNLGSPQELLLMQTVLVFFHLGGLPADAVMIYHLPIYRRFTLACFIYALARAIMCVITSFGLVFLGSAFGIFGMWFITLPLAGIYIYGVLHFEGLERKLGYYMVFSKQNRMQHMKKAA